MYFIKHFRSLYCFTVFNNKGVFSLANFLLKNLESLLMLVHRGFRIFFRKTLLKALMDIFRAPTRDADLSSNQSSLKKIRFIEMVGQF